MREHSRATSMRKGLKRSLTALAAVTILGLPLTIVPSTSLAATSPSAGSSWSILKTQNVGPFANVFNAADALSPSDVWAVGCTNDTNANCHTLIEHWNGTAWSVVPSPDEPGAVITELFGVSGTSSTDVWAVGDFTLPDQSGGPFVLHWNGTVWSQVNTPANTPGFFAVSAIAPDDAWAVGTNLAEHWDGHTWSTTTVPIIQVETVLQGVTALSATNVWAVGDFLDNKFNAHAVIMHWNGKSWSGIQSPDRGPTSQLFSVSAVSANDIWAVGEGATPLTVHWNGTSWTEVPVPKIPNVPVSAFYGVAAVSSSDVWAVGTAVVPGGPIGITTQALAEQWNGSKWTVSVTPNGGFFASGFGNLPGIEGGAVTATATTVFAVGSEEPTEFSQPQTLAESHPA
ncbi:MAG: hypothetical protein M3Z66_12550 [Chloroflexota bacterium]|nr:hypothetical protein [Chloroflexota bacterium]